MSTIFISHSSVDNALAVELLDWLKTQGYQSVFLDLDPDEGIEAGDHWEKVLYRELVSCSLVLALVTENWLASKWCFAEATHARSGRSMLYCLLQFGCISEASYALWGCYYPHGIYL